MISSKLTFRDHVLTVTGRMPNRFSSGFFNGGVTPDLYAQSPRQLDYSALVKMGIRHLLLDYDGTLAVGGEEPDQEQIEALQGVYKRGMFTSISIATDSGARLEHVAQSIGEEVRLFQPFEAGRLGTRYKEHPAFWRKILLELDCWNNPEQVANIGDSPEFDIRSPQSHGIKTVLVDRLFRELYTSRKGFQRPLTEVDSPEQPEHPMM